MDAGSVRVKATLDYGDFQSGINKMKEELNVLKTSLNDITGGTKGFSSLKEEFATLSSSITKLTQSVKGIEGTFLRLNNTLRESGLAATLVGDEYVTLNERIQILFRDYELLSGEALKASNSMVKGAERSAYASQAQVEGLTRVEQTYAELTGIASTFISETGQVCTMLEEESMMAMETAASMERLGLSMEVAGRTSISTTAGAVGLATVKNEAASAGASVEGYGNKALVARDRVNELDKASGLLRRTLSLLIVTVGFQLVTEIGQATMSMINARARTQSFGQMCGWTSQQIQHFTDKGRELQMQYLKIDMSQVTAQVAQLAHQYNISEEAAESMIETSAVFTAAMAREGRSAEDATLALKDYYDQGTGWARRMQEVGVTEEKLKATGLWKGEKDDIEGMNAALGEVLRQMNIYEEAMNISDPAEGWEALKVVFAEVGAELFEIISPDVTKGLKLLIGFLKQIHELIQGLKEWFSGLDPMTQQFIHTGALIGIVLGGWVVAVRKIIGPVYRLVAAFREWKQLGTLEKIFGKIPQTTGGTVDGKQPTTGGINGEIEKTEEEIDTVDKASKKFDKAEFKNKLKNMASKFALAGAAIGMTFALIGEVLLGIWVTLWALGEVGKQYQRYKPQIELAIKAMIEIAPILIVLGAAVWGVGYALDKLNVKTSDIAKMGLKSGVAIGTTFGLIAEVLAGVYVSVGIIAGIGSLNNNGMVEKGADTLTTISPILIVLGAAVSIFMIAMGTIFRGVDSGAITNAFKTAAQGIAAVLVLVAETIVMLIPSVVAIMGIGYVTDWLGGMGQVYKGVEALRLLGEVLEIFAPYILGFIGAVIIMGIVVDATGGVALEVLGVGIASVLGLLAGTILMLVAPIAALAAVGWVADVLGGYVEDGIRAIQAVVDGLGRIADSIVDTVYEVLMNALNKITNLAYGLSNLGNTLTTLAPSISNAAFGVFALKNALTVISIAFAGMTFQGVFTGLIQWAESVMGINSFDNIKQAVYRIADLARTIANSGMPDAGSIYATSSTITAVNGIIGNIEQTANRIAYSTVPSVEQLNSAETRIITALKCIINLGNQLNQQSGGATNGSGIQNLTNFINNLVNTLRNGANQIIGLATTYTAAGMVLGTALHSGLISMRATVGNAGVILISQAITSIQNRYGTFHNAGRTSGMKVAEGLRTGMARMVAVANAELTYTINAINSFYQKFYNAGKRLGEAETKGYQDGQDMHSPGLIARSTAEEMQRVEDYILEAVPIVENAAYQLGDSFSQAYTNNMSIDGADPSLTNQQYNQIQNNAATLTSLTNQATTTAMTDFNTLETGMSGTFNQMGLTATNTFNGINLSNQNYLNTLNTQTKTGMQNAANTTKNQLNQMQQSTTSTVTRMNNAWNSMSNHIVNAATQIRVQSYNKFSSLHRSISSFYNQLASAHFTAGLATGPSNNNRRVKIGEYGGNTGGRIRSFGSRVLRRIHPSNDSYGDMSNKRLSKLYLDLLDNPNPYLLAQLRSQGNPNDYYGAVSSNYNRIRNTVDQYSVADPWFLGIRIPMNNHVYDWENGKTKRIDASNFEEILRLVLTARGFRNPSTYSYYANSMKSNQQVWDSLSCNCYDGAEVIAEIGRMLGLGGSLVHGSWNGEGHMAALVAGKIYDMTQFQKHGVFRGTSGVVFGPPKESKLRRRSYGNNNSNSNNSSGVNLNINIDMGNTTIYGDADEFIHEMTDKIQDVVYKTMSNNPSTGW